MLCESLSIQPNFFSFSRMAVLEDLRIISGRDLVPLSDVLKIASLIRLGAFFVVKRKERAQLLLKVIGKQFSDWSSLLATE